MLSQTYRAVRQVSATRSALVATIASCNSMARIPFTAGRAATAAVHSSPSSVANIPSRTMDVSSARKFSTHAHSSHKPIVCVTGGNGAVGQAMVSHFQQGGWKAVSIDYRTNPSADFNVLLKPELNWQQNIAQAEEKIRQHLGGGTKGKSFSVMIHCAGSWLGGGLDAEGFLSTIDPMFDVNLKTAVGTSYLASKFMDQSSGSGLLILTGAAAAMHNAATPSMLAYGMSKAATHQLVNSLTKQPESGLKNTHVVCLLPITIDTPANRAAMGTAGVDSWTPPSEFAQLAVSFANQLQQQPSAPAAANQTHTKGVTEVNGGEIAIEHSKASVHQGGFYLFSTQKGKTTIKLVKQ